MRPTPYRTTEIDVAASIMTATEERPEIILSLQLSEFVFTDVKAREIAAEFASGYLCQPVKKFSSCRSWLYRRVRGGI